MEAKKQELEKKKQYLSPLAKDPTFGERTYDFVFNNLINFWVNLLASAAFTFWVSHSQNPIKTPFKQFSPPSVLQGKFATWIHDFKLFGIHPMSVFSDQPKAPGESSQRQHYSNNAANVMTLVTAGHPILIGSVWLGAKIKAPFVKFFDKLHYGKDALDDPSLKMRHAMVEAEERPTLFGAIVGRIGTIIATQFTVYSVGNHENWVKSLGKMLPGNSLKKYVGSFPGMDHVAEVVGNKTGEAVSNLMPEHSRDLDAALRDRNYTWSNQQKSNPEVNVARPYQNSMRHMGKYLAQDVLYTAVTSSTITPAINLLKRFIPGITYKPKVSAETRAILDRTPAEAIAPKASATPEPGASSPTPADAPRIQISQVKDVTRLAEAQTQLQHGGGAA